jgi:hypothetical protein
MKNYKCYKATKATKLQRLKPASLFIGWDLNFNKFFVVWIICIFFSLFSFALITNVKAWDLLEQAFSVSKNLDTIVNLGNEKDAVWNEVFHEWVWIQEDLWQWCFLYWEKIDWNALKKQLCETKLGWNYKWTIGANNDQCSLPNWTVKKIDNSEKQSYCSEIWWDRDVSGVVAKAPLIVRITKFLLRLTIMLSITMVLYNWVYYIIKASWWSDVKDVTKNIQYVVFGILIALASVGIINLISSLSISSLG